MKPTKSNRFAAVATLCLLPSIAFAVDRERNATVNPLNLDAAWDTFAPGPSDRAVWNNNSAGGATTLGADASWAGILISANTPTSGPLFTNAANPSVFTLTLGSSGIDLNAGASTNRGITFDTNTRLNLTANQTWKLGNGGTSANIVATTVISGAGSLEVTRDALASNYAQFGGANTFSGGFTLGAGSWVRVAVSSLNTGTTVNSGAVGTGNLTLNEGALLTTVTGTGYAITVPQINLLGNVTLNQNTGANGRLQIGGVWDLGGGSRALTIQKTSASLGSGQEGLALVAPSGFIAPKVQNGSLTFRTDFGVSGTPALVRFNTTSFDNNAALTVDDGVVIISQNGSFFGTGINSPALTLNANVSRGGGVIQLGDGGATMRSAQVYSLAGGGSISASNTTTTPAQTGTITINNGNSANFSGSIFQGGTGLIALTKSGVGTQTLSGTNSYTGKTTVSGGTLRIARKVSLYNNTPSNWTDTAIQVDSGTMLALNIGGSGEFTSSDIATLAALGTPGGGFRNGSFLGLDTTNAGGNFTYGNVLANPNAGANGLGLRKLGTGTLVLDQINTYTGGTIVDGGTLKIVQTGGIAGGSLVLNPGTSFEADFSALVAAGQVGNSTTGSGTISATPPNASQLTFTSGTLTSFAGTINVKPSPASNGRVDFNGLIGSGSTVNVDSGATARLAGSGTYSGITVNVSGTGGSGPGALRLEANTLDSSCAVNLTGNASIGSFAVTSTIDAVVADGGNGFSLTKAGSSTLVLTATNTYTGGTSVNGGTLRISKPYLANSSAIVIADTAILDLNFDETSGQVSDTVSTLTIDGVQQAAGIYGAAGSGATTINNTNFAGVGTLTVTTGPSAGGTYAAWIGPFGVNDPSFGGDPDNDGLDNGVENVLGANPSVYSNGLTQVSATANSVKFRHSQSNSIASDLTKTYQWSPNLVTWAASGAGIDGTIATIAETTITDVAAPDNDVIEVTVTVTAGSATRIFGRLVATKNP